MAPSLTRTGNVLLLIFATTCEILRIITILQKTKLKLRNINDLLKVTQPGGCGTDTHVQGCLAPKPIYCFLLNLLQNVENFKKVSVVTMHALVTLPHLGLETKPVIFVACSYF